MIQFNLLPDVKLEYIRARRTRNLIILGSILVSAAAVFVLVLLFTVVNIVQKKHLDDLGNDVKKYTLQLQNTPNLNKILTVQNQLTNLPSLNDKKPVANRLFTYVGQITPASVNIAKLKINFTDSTISITGAADTVNTINTFIDTMKFSTYTGDGSQDTKKAFSDVVLSSFGRDDKGASYTIDLKFDPTIFDSKNDIKLVVPNKITTRSETEKPTDLFQPNSNTKGQ